MHPGPLITRLQHDPVPTPVLTLEYYLDMSVETEEARVVGAINSATESIVGTRKGISRSPLTLVVKKDDVPDLTIIDLPDITRETNEMIMEYISPQETIILNAIPANVDFSTCESIKMSREVDKTGERKLVVITKADKSPEGRAFQPEELHAGSLFSKKKAKLISRVKEMVEMERVSDYTCDPEHVTEWNKFMESSDPATRLIWMALGG
ncbi:unnamed protein product [Cuscuta campestris]|uniref:Dynamin-type G domain-containing protein n=1 Tax=Cuscuta campestris TaxID=132261 RepID=A0A484L952_9ASTE|nr:unnamed protein product [Cuscuta campestris]